MSAQDIKVPDLGSFQDVPVIDVLVQPGDVVEVDTPLLTLETDKATMDVPSPIAGTVEAITVVRGAKVSTGSVIARIVASASTPTSASAAAAPTPAPVPAGTAVPTVPAMPASPSRALYDPVVNGHAHRDVEREGHAKGHRYVQARVGFGCGEAHGCGNSDVGSTGSQDRKDESVTRILE